MLVIGCNARGGLPVEELLQCTRLRDVEVVASQQSNGCPASDSPHERGLDPLESTLLHEGGENGDFIRLLEEWKHMPRERVALTSDRQRRVGGLSKVVPLPRNHMPDAPSGIIHIACVARDDVDMQMHDRLASCRARVEADVVSVRDTGCAIGMEHTAVELAFDVVNERQERVLFLAGRVKPGGDVPEGNDEGMTRRDWVAVSDREGEFVARHMSRGRQCKERRRRE